MDGSDSSYINLTDPFIQKSSGIRVVVCLTCALSVIGSLLIIASFVCFKELRTRVRLILVHLSLMDLGAAMANLIGAVVYFDWYYQSQNVSEPVEVSCVAQAAVAVFCTISSVLWTILLALYLYFLVVHEGSGLAKYTFYLFGALSYLLPLFVTAWLVATKKLGYSPYDSSGWCSLIVVPAGEEGMEADLIASIIGYDIWILLTMILVPVLYIAIRLHVHNRVSIITHNYHSRE